MLQAPTTHAQLRTCSYQRLQDIRGVFYRASTALLPRQSLAKVDWI